MAFSPLLISQLGVLGILMPDTGVRVHAGTCIAPHSEAWGLPVVSRPIPSSHERSQLLQSPVARYKNEGGHEKFWKCWAETPSTLAVAVIMSIAPASLAFQEAHLHDDRSLGLKVTFVIALIVANVAVALRIVSRRIANAPLRADDYTIIVALVSSIQSRQHLHKITIRRSCGMG